ncbi:tenascin-R [Elysia marginata]|uniref:Tenascin-R n=1 Tax=Elysia marginata TaxID=1093978 RepID=A0AAV4I4Y6_9GAST|nr:tenascin-R [Elysia marginata]
MSKHTYELRIDAKISGRDLFALYASFKIEDESDNYRLRLGSHSGTLKEKSDNYGLSYHNGHPFSTHDRDNESDSRNCAEKYHGAWWYKGCYHSNPNGKWAVNTESGMKWYTGTSSVYLSTTEMKIRRI